MKEARPTRFRKKPVEVDAFQFTGWTGIRVYAPSWFLHDVDYDGDGVWFLHTGIEPVDGISLRVKTLEGEMRADVGDWIIRGVAGEVYPCKRAIFEATYEEVSQ